VAASGRRFQRVGGLRSTVRAPGFRSGRVARAAPRMGITELTIATWPWLVTMLIFLVFVTYFPEMSLWLPRLLGML
jgi:hypothetical protein